MALLGPDTAWPVGPHPRAPGSPWPGALLPELVPSLTPARHPDSEGFHLVAPRPAALLLTVTLPPPQLPLFSLPALFFSSAVPNTCILLNLVDSPHPSFPATEGQLQDRRCSCAIFSVYLVERLAHSKCSINTFPVPELQGK